MMAIEEIRKNRDLVNMIDWDMTPEEAVTLYLEWGNNWSHGRMVKSKNDVSYYFVINTWEDTPIIYLVRRNSEEAVEMAAIELPTALQNTFFKKVGHNKGVYPIFGEVRDWLKKELDAATYHA